MRTKTRWAGFALAFVCVLATPSCVTAALWDEPCHGHGAWDQGEVVGRVLLTPFTLMIDCVLLSAYACGHCCAHGCH